MLSTKERDILVENHSLDSNRNLAVARLDQYLQTPREKILRAHQIDVMQSLRDYVAGGETAGYISLPTGSGKTVIATELIQALGMKTIVLSPTRIIKDQHRDTVAKFAPNMEMNGEQRNLEEPMNNLTYQLLASLSKTGKIKNPEEVQLIIADEAHTALGELRHTIYRQFPNALLIGLTATPYFRQLEGYEQRGLIDPNERWTNLFRNCIHEMTLEEAIERDILANVDVNLVRTNASVSDVEVVSGEYNKTQLERALNKEARNWLTIGMVAGLDAIPANVTLSPAQTEEIRRIHEQIKGKKTAIFGLSIDHVDALSSRLRDVGVVAAAVHSKLEDAKRREVLSAYERGETQVILGVAALRLGWDSPATEVGIYLAPTRSGTVMVQELGRILRTSPETGKETAIAIQLVDSFSKPSEAPILISNVFDPYYVLRGSQRGLAQAKGAASVPIEKAIITFSGIEVEALVEEAQSRFLLHSRLKQASLSEIGLALDSVVIDIKDRYPGLSPLNFYRMVAENLPHYIPQEKQHEALQALASIDSNTVALGKKTLLFLNLKTILTAAEHYFSDDEGENDELVQAAIVAAAERLNTLKPNTRIAQDIFVDAKRGVERYLAQREGVPVGWIERGWNKGVLTTVGDESVILPSGATQGDIDNLSNEIASFTHIPQEDVRTHTQIKNEFVREDDLLGQEYPFDEAIADSTSEELESQLRQKLSPREKFVLEKRFGLYGEEQHTLREIEEEIDLSRERVRQIEGEAIRKLRMANRSGRDSELYRYWIEDWPVDWDMEKVPTKEDVQAYREVDAEEIRLTLGDRILIAQQFKDEDLPKPVDQWYLREDFDLYPRTYRILIKAGITTVDQLAMTSEVTLQRILGLDEAMHRGAKPWDVRKYLQHLLDGMHRGKE